MAAHPIALPMTADEFIRAYAEDDENRYELLDGEVYERTLNGYTHDKVKNNLKKLFDRASVDNRGFECWVKHSFQASDSVVTPDVAIIASERLSNRTGNSPTVGAPEIAFEVAISDKPNVLQHKNIRLPARRRDSRMLHLPRFQKDSHLHRARVA